jgi:S1-C subfamily serine protease
MTEPVKIIIAISLIFLVTSCASTPDLKHARGSYTNLACKELKEEIAIVVGHSNKAVSGQGLNSKNATIGFLFGGIGANLSNEAAHDAEDKANEQKKFLYSIYDKKKCSEELYNLAKETAPSALQDSNQKLKTQGFPSLIKGTGFLFSSKDYVITNWHVVRGANNIKVKFLNGERIKANVAIKDPQNDIAFLKLARQPQLPPSNLKIGDSSNMKMGDKVFTIGYPAHWVMGDNPKYTEGVVNAISGLKDDPTVFQISVQIQPGNSGGPLFNSIGEVIGITQSSLDPKVAIRALGTFPQNVNYAIKSSYISALLPMLPQALIASRGIVVVPTEPKNSLANFIDNAKKNIVLIEASTK